MAAIIVNHAVDDIACFQPSRKCAGHCRLQWQAVNGHVSGSYDGITSWTELLLLQTAIMLHWVASKGLQVALALAYASAVLVDVVKRRQMA